MVKYHELDTVATPDRKRVGRGISSGYGKTAGRGTKGQNARTGANKGINITTGSRARIRQVPKKRGFKSKRVPAQVVYADQLNSLTAKTIDNAALFDAGLISTPYHSVKVIARKELTSKATVRVAGMSASVQAQLAKNGGKFEQTAVPMPVAEAKE